MKKHLCIHNCKFVAILMFCLVAITGLYSQSISRPYRAAMYSAIIPGAGQIYNKQYLKAGIVCGIQTVLIGTAIYHDGKVDKFQELSNVEPDPFTSGLYEARADEYRDKLTSDIWWIAITASLSIIDAYVDAHLVDFEDERSRIHIKFNESKLLVSLEF